MDDELVAIVQFPAIAAALFGQEWVDSQYELGSRDHKMYSGFVELLDRFPKAWWTYYQAEILSELRPDARLPSSGRVQRMHKRMEAIWRELGIEG